MQKLVLGQWPTKQKLFFAICAFSFFQITIAPSNLFAETTDPANEDPIILRVVKAFPHKKNPANSQVITGTEIKSSVPRVTKSSRIYYYGKVPNAKPGKYLISIEDVDGGSPYLEVDKKTLAFMSGFKEEEIKETEASPLHISEMRRLNVLNTQNSAATQKPETPPANPDEKCNVALTFDDGPEKGPVGSDTPALLSFLKENKVPATFYVLASLANKKANEDVMATMATTLDDNGNPLFLIANHSDTHAQLSAILNPDKLNTEITALESNKFFKKSVDDNYGKKYFRCPYGAYNSRVLKALKDAGYEMGHTEWNIDPNDWKSSNRNSEIVSSYIIKNVRELCADPKRREKGAVVLLHDIHPTSVEAAKIIVAQLKDSVNFVQIDEINKANSSFRIYKEPGEANTHETPKKKTPPPSKGKKQP